MRKAVDCHAVTAHRLDEARELVRAACHQGTLEAAVAEAVEHASGQADDILRGRADLRAQKVLSIVEADQRARERIDELARELHLARRDDHAVRDAAHEILHVSRADPDCHAHRRAELLVEDRRQALARADLEPFHAEHEALAREVDAKCHEIPAKGAQLLGAYRDDEDVC